MDDVSAVYEQHCREHCYTVYKPVWQEYQVPVKWTTYKPVYQQHDATSTVHGLQAVLAGVPGAGEVLHLPAGVPAASARSARPLHVPHRDGARANVSSRPTRASRSSTEHQYKVQRRRAGMTEKDYCPARSSRSAAACPDAGHFDPCTCRRSIAPARVSRQVQCPATGIVQRTLVPARAKSQTVRCCTRMVPKEQCHVESTASRRVVPVHSTRKVCHTTCRMVPEQHCKMVTCRKLRAWCPRKKRLARSCYTTCRMVRRRALQDGDVPEVRHGAAGVRQADPVHDLPDGAGRTLQDGDLQEVHPGPRGQGLPDSLHDMQDGGGAPLQDGDLQEVHHGP